jgi:hypothetical protein
MDAHLAELKRQHKTLDREIANAVKHYSTDDFTIGDLKRRKLHLKEQIEMIRKMTVISPMLHWIHVALAS